MLSPIVSHAFVITSDHIVTDGQGKIAFFIARDVWDAHMQEVRNRVKQFVIPRGQNGCPAFYPGGCAVYR